MVNDVHKLARQLMLNDCSSSVEQVLNEYFYLHENEWHHLRCDAEIEAYNASLKAKSIAGKASGIKRREQMLNKRSTNDELTKNQEPLTNNHNLKSKSLSADTDQSDENDVLADESQNPEKVKSKKAADETPYQEIIALYHEICPELPACKEINQKRKDWIRARWNSLNGKGEATRSNLDWWRKFFTAVAQSDWLMGRNEQGWRVNSFDWLVNATNFLKICEGGYTNKGGRR